MAVATPIDAAVNPNDTDQRLALWTNGRIDSHGGAPPVTDNVTWYTRFEPPAVAIHVTNWTTGSGYVLDYRGGFHPFGGAPALGDSSTPERVSGIPYSAKPNIRLYVDWSWDPAGTGQGYVLDLWGQLLPFGGATAPPRTGSRFPSPRARRLEMRWTPDKRAVTIDMQGRMYADFTGAAPSRPSSLGAISADVVRDFVVTDWTTRSGHILEKTGRTHAFGSASDAYGYPYRAGGDVARVLKVLSASDPTELWQVWAGGQQYEYVSSTAPSVTAGGDDPVSPADTVTDTTRPVLAWDYSDPQGDSQAAWQLLVFTQAFVDGHGMSNPLLWAGDALVAVEGIDRGARGITCPVDLPDGDYRMYVRAQDTAGQWSLWSSRGWTQDVPEPTTPTDLTATADPDNFSVDLSVSATTGGVADLIRFEFSDDGEVTWQTVRGAGAVELETTTTATDYDVPLGVERSYRARAYAVDPAVVSSPSNTDSALITDLAYVVTAVDDPTLGGEFRVQEPVDWVRPVRAGEFQGLGAEFATVVKDGVPKGKKTTLHVFTDSVAAWQRLEDLAESGSTLVYRDPFGEVRYCEIIGDWTAALMPGAAERHLYDTDLPLVEVAPPDAD